MSAFEVKQTWRFAEVRFRGRYWWQSGHGFLHCKCPLVTQSGHGRLRIGAVQLDPKPYFSGRKSLL
jgi:hypothetical protein